jgi:hypothetical protein
MRSVEHEDSRGTQVEVLVWARGEAVEPASRWRQAATVAMHLVAVAGALAAGFAADSRLCPEHRVVVELTSGVGAVLTMTSVFGVLRARAWGTWTLVVGACGSTTAALIETLHGISMPLIFLPAQMVALAVGAVTMAQRRELARRVERSARAEWEPLAVVAEERAPEPVDDALERLDVLAPDA